MKNNLSTKFSLPVVALGCIMLIIMLQGCKHDKDKEEKEPAVAHVAATVEVFPAKKELLVTSLQIPGELTAFQRVDLYAKENSFVKKLYADVGSKVAEGQMLALMEAPELSSQLSSASSNLQSKEAIYAASKANYDRLVETSKTPGTIAPNELDLALARRNSELAQLKAAKSDYDRVMDTKNYLQIKAPFGGVISSRNVNTGAYVGPSGKGSDKPLFTLEEQKNLRLSVSVPESYTSFLHDRDTVRFSVSAYPGKTFTAFIKRLAGSIDQRLRSQRIEMDVNNADTKLLPGMVANVNISLSPKDSSFIVPKAALVISSERIFVIRVTDNKYEWVDVKKGREVNGRIEIFGKLNAADMLVKTANEELRNGSAVAKTKLVAL